LRAYIPIAILSKKSNAGGITFRFQTILQSNSNKNSILLAQKQIEDQWNRIEDPDMNPHSYPHLIFHKGTKEV
jgi:hypothetical protein